MANISRKQWGSRHGIASVPKLRLPADMVVIHHTVTAWTKPPTLAEQKAFVRSIEAHHVEKRGYWAIGYSFLVGPGGDIFAGRGWDRVGAHTAGYNSCAMGIAVLGNFEHRRPSSAALRTLTRMLRWGIVHGKIKPGVKLYGHRDRATNGTLCPGRNLYAKLPALREAIT